MNRSTRIARLAAIALSFAAAGSAFAETPTIVNTTPTTHLLSRAEVTTELAQAAQSASWRQSEVDLSRFVAAPGLRSRDDVRAEAVAALASGNSQSLRGDDDQFRAPYTPTRLVTVQAQLTASIR